jgi:hypothetical protein
MKVLIGMEFSGKVRDAFLRRGHDAVSADLRPTEVPGPHYEGDVFDIIDLGWDLAIFHPECTHLAVSGAKHFARKRADGSQAAALDVVRRLLASDIPLIALENPVSIISSRIRKPEQIIQPYWFGHKEFKKTCLWLKGLPALTPTDWIQPPCKATEPEEWKRWNKVHREPPGPNRQKNRSRTYAGVAEAMAAQWG